MASTEPISNEPKSVVPPQPSDDSEQTEPDTEEHRARVEQNGAISNPEQVQTDEKVETDTEKQTDNTEQSGSIFQAVGVITGLVKFTDENKSSITIGRKEYQLFYAPRKQRAFEALKKEIEATGESTQRLVVYPKVIHFPKKDQPHRIAFQLVGFDKGRQAEVISEELQDMEFKLCGLWQFIPVCPTPCISVFRNFTTERLEYIKTAELAKKIKFMKASHLPLLWKDAPVRPFRFNPKAGKDQGHPAFVEIKAKFLPQRDVFGFDTLLALPQDRAPKFLKASKKDKASAQAAKKDKAPVQAYSKDKAPVQRDKPKPKPKAKS
jgi:hypothetical protein